MIAVAVTIDANRQRGMVCGGEKLFEQVMLLVLVSFSASQEAGIFNLERQTSDPRR
jgi:hypothetical protein